MILHKTCSGTTGWFWRGGNFCRAVPALYFVISLDKEVNEY